jgi:hypothetical protein
MELIEAQVLDESHLKLSHKLTLPPGARIFITISASDQVEEEQAWVRLAAQQLEMAYGEEEPDYSVQSIKQPNPDFRP